MKHRWLRRDIILGPYLTLCQSQADFNRALKHLKLVPDVQYLKGTAQATTHCFDAPSGDMVCIVCLGPHSDQTGIQVAALLVHEAVHCWQFFKQHIGEADPSHEFEAYSVQALSQALMVEYARQNGLACG